MSAVSSKNLDVYNARRFKESATGTFDSANIYFTIGRVTPWVSELSPPQANTSVHAEYEIWRNMIGAKKITGYDVRQCVPRYDWVSGRTYQIYDDATDSKILINDVLQYYVLTDDWNVYKCIYNNGGRPSTEKPDSRISVGTFTTADNYVWKYMYTIKESDRLRFTSDSYMPVTPSVEVQQQAVKGEISVILPENSPASDYPDDDIYIVIQGDGEGANAFAVRDTVQGTISRIILDNPGTGYTYANATILGSGSGTNTKVVISPPGGHGSDPYAELGACYVMINPQLNGSESGKLITKNDYRQICIVDGPKNYGTSSYAGNTVIDQTLTLTLTGVSVDYILDEIVYQGTEYSNAFFTAVVADWDSTNSIIKLCNYKGTPTVDSLVGVNSGGVHFVNAIIPPDLEPNSGKILYIDNLSPVERAADQTDSFQIIMKF